MKYIFKRMFFIIYLIPFAFKIETIEFFDLLIHLNFKSIINAKLGNISFVCSNVNLYLFNDPHVRLFPVS